MKNYVQEGSVVTLTAPYNVASGAGAKIGSIIAIACSTIASGVTGEFKTDGVFTVNKTSAQAWTEGLKIYWDDTAKEFTSTSSSNTLCGVAVAAAANPTATGVLRLNGSF
jgi:predicted RecA/RadA family phage recombinase